jgi:hypothetical protein
MRRNQVRQFLNRFIAFAMALYLFNFSIDTRDAHPDHIAEDLSLNDIESIFEFSLECIIGIHNAVAEHDERDQDHGGSFDFNKIFYCCPVVKEQSAPAIFIQLLHLSIPVNEGLLSGSIEIHSPPPRG